MPRTKVRLNVRRATGEAQLGARGIRVLADKLDHSPFEAVTGLDGAAEIDIPRVAGRWRITSKEPGYAEVWAFFQVESDTETVELGRFEVTRLKQVTIRWVMPKHAGSNRFSAGETVDGIALLKSYDIYDSPDGIIRRDFSFATRGLIDVKWTERSDLQLVQSGSGEILVEVEPGLRSTTLLEFFPGTFALLDKSDQAAMCDLGDVPLESVAIVPVDQLRPLTDRGQGLPVTEGHTFALRSFDGRRYVLLRVEKIEDQPLGPAPSAKP